MSRRARQLNRDVAETPLWKGGERGVVHGDDAADEVRSLFRYEGCVKALLLCQEYLGGVVVGHRSGVSEEHGRLGIDRKGVRFEAKVGDRIYLEDRIAGGTGNRGFRCGVWGRHGNVAAKNFAGIL